MAVRVALHTTARITGAVELVRIALLLRRIPAAVPLEETLEHESDVPAAPLH